MDMFLLQGAGGGGGARAAGDEERRSPAKLLVIAADKQAPDWAKLMQGQTLDDGRPVDVVQCGWHQILCSAEPKTRSPLLVHLDRSVKNLATVAPTRTLQPDMVLVRNEVETPTASFRNQLVALMFGGCDGVNSLGSIFNCIEKGVVQAELHRLNRELGDDVFPVMEQQFFATHAEMMYTQAFPAVVKVGSAHAGMGKMKIEDHHQMADFRTIMAMMSSEYCTAEPFIDGEFDLRIQKIGPHYRAYRRISMSGDWKTNTGTSHIEDIEPVPPNYRRWADEASRLFGGMDICTVDAIHDRETGREYIMEINGTSSGLGPSHMDEDNVHIRELVLAKMNARLCRGEGPAAVGAAAAGAATAAVVEEPGGDGGGAAGDAAEVEGGSVEGPRS